jgi:hypothetical protein
MNRTVPELCKENESPGSSVPWHNWHNWHINSTSKAEQSRAKQSKAEQRRKWLALLDSAIIA